MNYQRIYNEICQRAKNEVEIRRARKLSGEYFEGHHIIPECLGGTGKSYQWYHENITPLTAKEHYICHLLLFKIHPKNDSIIRSFYMMGATTRHQERFEIKKGSRYYEEAKKLFCENHHNKTEENRLKISKRQRGKKRPKEIGEKVAKALRGRKLTNEVTRNKIIERNKKLGLWKGDKNPGCKKENQLKSAKSTREKLGKKVVLTHPNKSIQKEYDSIRQASKILDIHKNIIRECCKTGRIYKEYKFEYKK